MSTCIKPTERLTRRRCLALFASATTSSLMGMSAPSQPQAWQGIAMGGDASISLEGFGATESKRLIEAATEELDRLEQIFSLYRQTSAISQLNLTGHLKRAPSELTDALNFCSDLHITSQGAFDPSVQRLWEHYSSRKQTEDTVASASAERQAAQAAVGFHRVDIVENEVILPPGMALTLNGVAQGIITDKIATLFRDAGAKHTLINLGEFRATGPKADGSAWRLGLRDPNSHWRINGTLPLTVGAVATSAASGHQMGQAHHLIDPATGESAPYYSSVTVMAPTATLADGLSTALYVLPFSQAERLVARYPGVSARFTLANGVFKNTAGWRGSVI